MCYLVAFFPLAVWYRSVFDAMIATINENHRSHQIHLHLISSKSGMLRTTSSISGQAGRAARNDNRDNQKQVGKRILATGESKLT